MSRLPVLMAGAGAMGGAIVAGWRRVGAKAAEGLIISDPSPGVDAVEAAKAGALLNPGGADIARARTMVLAVKPQIWRSVVASLAPRLNPQAVIVSMVAGVAAGEIRGNFGGRHVARVMPTLAAAIGQGSFALWAEDELLAQEVADLFSSLGVVTRLDREEQMHAATAVSGSGPAYLYALVEALEAAAIKAGLPADAAAQMVRATLCGAATQLAESKADPTELRRRVTSAGGTTEAALEVLIPGLGPLVLEAVTAAVSRSRELGG